MVTENMIRVSFVPIASPELHLPLNICTRSNRQFIIKLEKMSYLCGF